MILYIQSEKEKKKEQTMKERIRKFDKYKKQLEKQNALLQFDARNDNTKHIFFSFFFFHLFVKKTL